MEQCLYLSVSKREQLFAGFPPKPASFLVLTAPQQRSSKY